MALTPTAVAGADLLGPADGVYEATITRTAFGIPHILAEDYGSLGFGQGYGAAQDVGCSIAEVVVTGRAERSKWFGPDERYTDQVTLDATNLEVDTLFGDIINQGTVEALVESDDPGVAPSAEVKAMIEGYIAGYNAWLEDVGGPDGIDDPACAGQEWVTPATPMDLYRGIYAANLLASAGVFVSEIASATPPTEDGDLGLPVGAAAPAAEPRFAPVPDVLPTVEELDAALGRGESLPFGSNGTALGSATTDTGRGMVLGNPHFPWQGRYRFTQTQLTIPGVYDVRGGMLHGSPVVNIGWTDHVAWTHTVSTAFRFTPYEYRLLGPTTYLSSGGPKELERREVEVELPDGSVVTEDLYATDEGYVLDAPSILLGWTPFSVWAIRDANAEHLKTLDVFHEMAKARTVEELAEAQIGTMGIPWVNTMAADRDGTALYADNSVVPHVTDEMAQRCLTPVGRALFQLVGLPGLDGTRAQGDCAWGSDEDAPRDGIFGEANLPDVTTDSWVVNANDSYWLPNPELPLTGFARIIGCEECLRSLRTRMVYRYVLDRLDGSDGLGGADEFTHDQLMRIQTENRVYGAELAREDDDLQDVCAAADVPTAACDALAGWDGRTDVDSRGAILFREFFTRGGAQTWEVPFDADDPVNTPRDLEESDDAVIAAFEAGVARLDDAGVAYDAPLGSQQKAGDDGAGDISVHGGFGSTGNANVIAIRNPTANTDVLYPISYGSSHIQAVAFDDDGVEGCTILTYGQSYDPTSDFHDDQTRLWEGEEWVCWPRTQADITAEAIETTVVRRAVAGGQALAAADDRAPMPATGGGLALAGVALAAAALGLRRRTDA
jgi:acyl-homoserine-lactone acylase